MRVDDVSGGRVLPRTTLILIASAGHSGSTLLDLLLGNHSNVSGAGEMNRLTLYPDDRACACGAAVAECAYWNAVRRMIGSAAPDTGQVRWSDYHTDIPPQEPVLEIEPIEDELMVSGVRLPPMLRSRLEAAGLRIGQAAVLSRGGTRDVKWRVLDSERGERFVLRRDGGRLQVYAPLNGWKNPLRFVPDVMEAAAALGSLRVAKAAAAASRRAARHLETARNSWIVADAIAASDGTKMVVDSSKSAVRLKLLHMCRPEHVRIINLVRDGRAVAASAMRRQGTDARGAARVWKRENRHLALVLRSVPDRLKHQVSYERLCDDSAGELQRICAFLGLDFEERMLTLWGRDVHNIPGNPMLFRRGRKTISKDERWRRDLSDADVRAFERAAGTFNRSLGYV